MSMTTTLEYIAAGGNRHSSAADWASSLLAFGAGNNIALWNPEDEQYGGVTSLLAGHTDAVNAVKILETETAHILISGGADSTIRIWKAAGQTSSGFQEKQCLTEHTSSINALAICAKQSIFLSGSADATVKVWQFEYSTAKLVQSISLKPRFLPLALATTSLSDGTLVFAVAGTSNIIQLYVRLPSSTDFELQASLTGHDGWIRSLDFTRESADAHSDVFLASASQDKYLRIWRLHQGGGGMRSPSDVADGLAMTEKKSLSNKAHQIGSVDRMYSVTFEALLIGHEDWIYTAKWKPVRDSQESPVLLSASADNSLSIWQRDLGSGLWVCNSRLGEISSQKGSTTATGSAGGFWIGLWQPKGQSIVSLGRTGSWRKWDFNQSSDMWLQRLGISGHVQEVQSIAWSPEGNYLLSTSSDQTTRLFAEWRREDGSSWHEFSRPQIHGYDLNCIDPITENQFISGADEKLLRVFNEPRAIVQLLQKLTGATTTLTNDLPDAANIPVLGLSNKAMDAIDDGDIPPMDGDTDEREAVDPASIVHKSALDLDQPPFEDHLARHTLWPEHEKLYGHGYEISTVATSTDGRLVATACKASSLDHAVIRLYDTRGWRELRPPLAAHALTVTALRFSPDDRFLLSVGRDRQWALFARSDPASPGTFTLRASNPRGHARMILDCSWAPLEAGHVFATAGRDKSVKVWKVDGGGGVDCVTTIPTSVAATAVAFSPAAHGEQLLLALGGEGRMIALYWLARDTLDVVSKADVDDAIRPSATVKALRWRPAAKDSDRTHLRQLAAASDDCSLRIYNVS